MLGNGINYIANNNCLVFKNTFVSFITVNIYIQNTYFTAYINIFFANFSSQIIQMLQWSLFNSQKKVIVIFCASTMTLFIQVLLDKKQTKIKTEEWIPTKLSSNNDLQASVFITTNLGYSNVFIITNLVYSNNTSQYHQTLLIYYHDVGMSAFCRCSLYLILQLLNIFPFF